MPLDVQPSEPSLTTCPNCGVCLPATVKVCSSCGHRLDEPPSNADAQAFSWPHTPEGASRFDGDAIAILQFLPSGTCVSLPLARPIVLGYGEQPADDEDLLDLTEFNAAQRGVSYRHCRLQRHEAHLIITDLGSIAGTRLNNEVLPPHDERVVRHGDRLVMGTLHVIITFSVIQS